MHKTYKGQRVPTWDRCLKICRLNMFCETSTLPYTSSQCGINNNVHQFSKIDATLNSEYQGNSTLICYKFRVGKILLYNSRFLFYVCIYQTKMYVKVQISFFTMTINVRFAQLNLLFYNDLKCMGYVSPVMVVPECETAITIPFIISNRINIFGIWVTYKVYMSVRPIPLFMEQ